MWRANLQCAIEQHAFKNLNTISDSFKDLIYNIIWDVGQNIRGTPISHFRAGTSAFVMFLYIQHYGWPFVIRVGLKNTQMTTELRTSPHTCRGRRTPACGCSSGITWPIVAQIKSQSKAFLRRRGWVWRSLALCVPRSTRSYFFFFWPRGDLGDRSPSANLGFQGFVPPGGSKVRLTEYTSPGETLSRPLMSWFIRGIVFACCSGVFLYVRCWFQLSVRVGADQC